MRRRMRGYTGSAFPQSVQKASANSIRVTLSRLKAKGLIRNQNGLWNLTKKGLGYLSNKLNFHPRHKKSASARKNMIIAFDVPERHRKKRDWLRIELRNLGFEMLQKSVWFGPAPLPTEFVSSLEELNLIPFMKFFEAKKSDII